MKCSIRSLCGSLFNSRDVASEARSSADGTSGTAPSAVSGARPYAPQTLLGLQDIGQARPVSPVEPELRTLAPALYTATHAHHGEFSLKQLEKPSDSKVVEFELRLDTRKGDITSSSQTMFVANSDPEYGGRSTFGYGDLNLRPEMRQKGIGYLLHHAGADAATKLKVQRLVVSNVVSEPMHTLCDKMGMTNDGVVANSYSGDPQHVAQITADKAQAKGWRIDRS